MLSGLKMLFADIDEVLESSFNRLKSVSSYFSALQQWNLFQLQS